MRSGAIHSLGGVNIVSKHIHCPDKWHLLLALSPRSMWTWAQVNPSSRVWIIGKKGSNRLDVPGLGRSLAQVQGRYDPGVLEMPLATGRCVS